MRLVDIGPYDLQANRTSEVERFCDLADFATANVLPLKILQLEKKLHVPTIHMLCGTRRNNIDLLENPSL